MSEAITYLAPPGFVTDEALFAREQMRKAIVNRISTVITQLEHIDAAIEQADPDELGSIDGFLAYDELQLGIERSLHFYRDAYWRLRKH